MSRTFTKLPENFFFYCIQIKCISSDLMRRKTLTFHFWSVLVVKAHIILSAFSKCSSINFSKVMIISAMANKKAFIKMLLVIYEHWPLSVKLN